MQLELLEHTMLCIFFKKVLISRNKQAYLNQKEKKFAFEEHIFTVENGLKREICNIHGNSGLEIGLEILSVLWLIKIHPR